MTIHYLQDFRPGQTFETGSITVTEAMIVDFARRYDPQPFHTDPEAAKGTLFGGLVASGWHTLALTMGLGVRSELKIVNGVVGLGVEAIRWPKPVRPGNTLTATLTVLEIILSRSRAGWCVVKMRWTTRNEHGDAVVEMESNCWVRARETAAPSTEEEFP